MTRHNAEGSYVAMYARSQEHTGENVPAQRLKNARTKLAHARKKTGFIFFTSSVATLRQILEQQKILLWILLKQNKIVGALSEYVSVNKKTKNGEQARRQTKNASLKLRRQRVSNNLNDEDKLETTVLDRGDSKRAPN